MPRPKPTEPVVSVTVRMPERLRDALLAAAPEGTSISDAVRAACEASLAPTADLSGPVRRQARKAAARPPARSRPVDSGPCPHPVGLRIGGVCMPCGKNMGKS